MTRFAMIPVVLVVVFAMSALGAVPHQISYQGRLTDVSGDPVDTTADLTIVICQDEAGSIPLWGETHAAVAVVDGLFDLALGSINPIPDELFDGSVRWLGVQIESGPLSTPLVPVVSTAYAIRSVYSDTAAYAHASPGGVSTGWVDDGSVVRLQNSSDRVGIGTSTANEPLVVGDDLGSYDGNYVVVGNADFEGYSGVMLGRNADNRATLRWYGDGTQAAFAVNSAGQNFNNVLTVGRGQVGVNTDGGTAALNVNGSGWIGDSLIVGGRVGIGTNSPGFELEVKSSGSSDGFRVTSSDGSQLFRVRESSGGSSEVYVSDDAGNTGVLLRGIGDSYFNAGSVGIGTTSPAGKLHVVGTGNSSVQLPTDAISAAEILDEPGVKSHYRNPEFVLPDGSWATVCTTTVAFPAAGYAVIVATCETEYYTGIQNAHLEYGIADYQGSAPPHIYSRACWTETGSGEPDYHFHWWDPVNLHEVFTVSAGTKTFYLLVNSHVDWWTHSVWDARMTVMYFPTKYDPALAATSSDASGATPVLYDSEVAPESAITDRPAANAQVETDDLASIREELRMLKEEIAELKAGR